MPDESDEPWRSDPATERQKKKLRFFKIRIKTGLTKGEASDLIDAAVTARPDREADYQAEKADEEALWLLEEMMNDEDTREIGHYKKLTKAQLRQLLAYLSDHVPDSRDTGRFDLCDLVPLLFPEQLKARREPAPSQRKSAGCLVMLLSSVIVCLLALLARLASP